MTISPAGEYLRFHNASWVQYTHVSALPGLDTKDIVWKLHASVTNGDAINELHALCRQFGIGNFKIRRNLQEAQLLEGPITDDQKQYGKTFVVYHSKTDARNRHLPIDWTDFIEKADQIIRRHHAAGMPVRGDRKIPGSSAIYFRCEVNPSGNYVGRNAISYREGAAGEECFLKRYCPYEELESSNPFQNIRLGEARQWTPQQVGAFHAIYDGDIEYAYKLCRGDPRLLALRDPVSHQTMLDTAKMLADIERRITPEEKRRTYWLQMPDILAPRRSPSPPSNAPGTGIRPEKFRPSTPLNPKSPPHPSKQER